MAIHLGGGSTSASFHLKSASTESARYTFLRRCAAPSRPVEIDCIFDDHQQRDNEQRPLLNDIPYPANRRIAISAR